MSKLRSSNSETFNTESFVSRQTKKLHLTVLSAVNEKG